MITKLNNNFITTNYLMDKFKLDPLVNTIKFGSANEIDLNKNILYPLVHIEPTGFNALEENAFFSFSFNVAVVNQRNKEPNKIGEFEDNLIDNLNLTSGIITRAINRIMLDNNAEIYLNPNWNARPIMLDHVTVLDGYLLTIEIEIRNDYAEC